MKDGGYIKVRGTVLTYREVYVRELQKKHFTQIHNALAKGLFK